MILEMITPIRGRKQALFLCCPAYKQLEMITPIRGRKLVSCCRYLIVHVIRNDNPDKGTETNDTITDNKLATKLEMITPIRGRKL